MDNADETIEVRAGRLLCYTMDDLRTALHFTNDLQALRHALELLEHRGAGYGSGKTAAKLISARLKKITKGRHP